MVPEIHAEAQAELQSTKSETVFKEVQSEVKSLLGEDAVTEVALHDRGTRSNVFFVKHPLENSDRFLMSVVKVPNNNKLSVELLNDEAAIYQHLAGRVSCVPEFYGYNPSESILHVGFIYKNIESGSEFFAAHPVDATIALLESVQELHEAGVVHNDLEDGYNGFFTADAVGVPKALFIDLGLAEIYTGDEAAFSEGRLYDIRCICKLFSDKFCSGDMSTRIYDKARVTSKMQEYGFTQHSAELVYELGLRTTRFKPSIEEMRTIVDELRTERSLKNEGSFVPLNTIDVSDAWPKARESVDALTDMLLEYRHEKKEPPRNQIYQ